MSVASDPSCIFCKIAAGAVPVTPVFADELVVAFPDMNPQAPTHILVIPREHLPSVAQATGDHEALLGRLLGAAAEIAAEKGLGDGYRLVINTGDDGGQTVPHLHIHLLGGRHMSWPPG